MYNTFKKIISCILCTVISVSVCACQQTDQNSRNDQDEQSIQPASQNQPVEDSIPEQPRKGSSSIFIYMCGSDLETKQGIASNSIKELLQAEVPDNMNIIIETGGAQRWRGLAISSDVTERYKVKDGKLVLIEKLDKNMNMGDPETFSDFASWCDKNYLSERNMLIIWDHGSGSVNGVCFDENHGYDSLDPVELNNALKKADLSCKYDIIGFDACLMASVETMIAVNEYADYMIASQEIEPSCGWELKTAAETFSKETDPVKTGESICDNYIERCKEKNENDKISTMTLLDLKKTDDLLDELQNAFDKDKTGKAFKLSDLIDSAHTSKSFGTGGAYDIYSNIIDLRSFVYGVGIGDDILEPLLNTIDSSVLHLAKCGKRNNNGISFYYPNNYNEKEIKKYLADGPITNYNSLLESFYTNIPNNTLSFSDKGSISEDGAFTVSLTPESSQCLNKVYFELYETDEDGSSVCIGKGGDFFKDWDDLTFKSNFRGTTVSMGGHRLYYEITNSDYDYMMFNAPMSVNGKQHNYVFSYMADENSFNGGYYISVGIIDGYDEHGLPQRDIVSLKDGDKIKLFDGVAEVNGRQSYIPGEEYVLKVLDLDEFLSDDSSDEDTEVFYEIPLECKTYKYVFVAEDFFGQTFRSDAATLEMTKTYEELLENPLTNGNYAAKVTKIEPAASDITE